MRRKLFDLLFLAAILVISAVSAGHFREREPAPAPASPPQEVGAVWGPTAAATPVKLSAATGALSVVLTPISAPSSLSLSVMGSILNESEPTQAAPPEPQGPVPVPSGPPAEP